MSVEGSAWTRAGRFLRRMIFLVFLTGSSDCSVVLGSWPGLLEAGATSGSASCESAIVGGIELELEESRSRGAVDGGGHGRSRADLNRFSRLAGFGLCRRCKRISFSAVPWIKFRSFDTSRTRTHT